MDFLFDLLQSAGIGAAVGIGAPLAALVVSALGVGDLGLDFEGTDWAWLESEWLMLALFVSLVLLVLAARRGAYGDLPIYYVVPPLVLGALYGAGSMADRGHSVIAGAAAGAACAALAYFVAQGIFSRVRRRLDSAAAAALPAYGQAVGLAAAGLSVLFPPLAAVLIAGLVFLLAGGRRREGEKYAGLRILR